jgi:F-type H+-transporting ATPase subunit gamma
MPGVRHILQRRRAAASIGKITRTMEMVSTARYKAYYNRWVGVVDYNDALAQAAYLLVTPQKPIDHPLLKENSSGRMAIVVIGSTRGLCGLYNASISRLVQTYVGIAKNSQKKLDIYAPDRKVVGMLNYHGIVPTKIFKDFGEVPSDFQVNELADEFISQYINGQLDYFGIIYMRFYSVTSQQAQLLTIMPLTELIDDLTTRATVIWPWELSFEDFFLSPSAGKVVEGLARMLIRSSIRNCFMDSALSEHLARMVAMRNATENADEMIKELTLQYNRARQSQITGELLDIIGGTGALL